MIKLNDILNLTPEQISNSKIDLNMKEGKHGDYCFNVWLKSGKTKVNFSYHNTDKVAHHKVGQWEFGFVQFPDNHTRWLFVTSGVITSVPPKGQNGFCEHKSICDRFDHLIGRLVIEIKNKKSDQGRYCYNLSKHLDNAEVIEILPKSYEREFTSFGDLHLQFAELADILDGKSSKSILEKLREVYGVYVLSSDDGHLYVGSATGENGLAQRWKDYIFTQTGGDKALIELYNKDKEYFKNHFYFAILEVYSKRTDPQRVKKAEQYWKDILKTSKGLGLNRN